jgi:hypothetical protein
MNEKKLSRSEALRKIAFYENMDFREKDEFKMINYLRPFRLFNAGSGRKISNILISKEPLLEGQIRSFDYQYTVSSGKSSVTYRQTVFWANSKLLGIPPFRMQPETFMHRIGTFLGMQDIDFELYPEFSKKYLLRSSDEESIRDFFTDKVLSFFSDLQGLHLEALNYYFILYRDKKLADPVDYPAFLDTSRTVYKLFRDISQQLYGYQEEIRYRRLFNKDE